MRNASVTSPTHSFEGDEDPRIVSARNVARVIDEVATSLYFASGAFERDDRPGPTAEQRTRLYREAAGMIDVLAGVDLPQVTHHLIEMLEGSIADDPRGVFVRIVAAVEGGRGGGYQFDPMADA